MFSCVTVDAPLMIPCRGVTCSDWGEGGWVGCGGGSVNVMFSCVTVDAPLMIPCRGVTCSDWGEGGWVGWGREC